MSEGNLSWKPADRGRVEVSYAIGDEVLARALLHPASEVSRRTFLKNLVESVPTVDLSHVDQQIMQIDVDAVKAADKNTSGRRLDLDSVEPWDEPVDGEAVLDELAKTVARYVVVADGALEAIVLWIATSHIFDAFEVSPRLAITSPEKRCGKSTCLDVIGAFANRPLQLENISPAALFRTIEVAKPTLLVDEADTFLTAQKRQGSDTNHELRGVLNSGHRSGGTVVRCVGEDSEPRQFATFAPVAIAMIGDLPDTLADRSIPIDMRRRKPGETIERMRPSRIRHECTQVRRQLARWTNDIRGEAELFDPEVPAELTDRAADNWRPLLALADLAGGTWPDLARAACCELQGVGLEDDEDQPAGTMLLHDLREVFRKSDTDRLSTDAILTNLIGLPDRPWAEWRRGDPLTARGLAKLIRPYGSTLR